jgi:hypothetical protein
MGKCAFLGSMVILLLGLSSVMVNADPLRPPDNILAKMLDAPGLPADPTKIAWSALPSFKGERIALIRGVENESGFSHHPAITFWDGRFFAQWNDGYVGEDLAGQRVRFATSRDAKRWSAPIDLTGRPPGRRYTACGFWLRGGECYALAALRDPYGGPNTGETPVLLAYRWNSQKEAFEEPKVIAKDFFAQNIPMSTPAGDWLILGKGGSGSWDTMKSARGGVRSIDDWVIKDLPGAGLLEEAEWYTLPNNHLVAHFRTRGTGPLFLARSYSTDSGKNWSDPVVTNFPEKGARHHGLRLTNGLYALLVNPNSVNRIPFSIALSRDGLVYDRIANVRAEPTKPRWEGRAKSPGYHYMRGFEHDGKLYTIYSVNKEDIEMTIIPLEEFTALYQK